MKREKNPFILGINGSPHKKGTTVDLLQATLNGAKKAGAETRIIHLYDLFMIPETGLYSEDRRRAIPKNMPNDDVVALYPEIIRADGFVFATPVYWANMSGVMKLFIEHLTPLENDGFKLQGKVASFIAASKENEGGLEMAAASMVMAVAQMGVLIPPNGIMWSPGSWPTSNRSIKSWAHHDAPIIGRNMVELIRLLKKNKINWDE